jgi:hypothetical protein
MLRRSDIVMIVTAIISLNIGIFTLMEYLA